MSSAKSNEHTLSPLQGKTPKLKMASPRSAIDLEELLKHEQKNPPTSNVGEKLSKQMSELAKDMLGDPDKQQERLRENDEQQQAYERHRQRINPFNIRKPLSLTR